MELLKVESLSVSYGISRVLHDVSLTVKRGELVSLVGRNGVGKSTTMRGIMGLTLPRSGSIIWKGQEILRRAPHRNARDGLGYVPEDRRVFSRLTVWENLDVARLPAPEGMSPWNEERVFDLFPDLKVFRDRQGGLLSGGQQQMLTIARTLMGNPELLLLDEPSEGIAPIVVAAIEKKIYELKALGLSIVLAEQNLDFVLALSDRCYVLEKGCIVYTGSSDDLRHNTEIQGRYLHI
ncbi:ABC transporter ATP-binding protein [Paraburkholderia strydomiana]|uniref:ABC transporter ATP-binding protein n=1 Tax=Paraburkholderia strydomiana TaxID=1245417 RepID=UPI001BE6967D|nr:ABC transporter ATP-binding protein [Paraburkholderia strydomiana]MBT2793565.1 ABC transporter ATP-binding protein [Paraburkholderia strydomiana]